MLSLDFGKKKPKTQAYLRNFQQSVVYLHSSLCNTEEVLQFDTAFFLHLLHICFLIRDTNNHVQNVLSYCLINSNC